MSYNRNKPLADKENKKTSASEDAKDKKGKKQDTPKGKSKGSKTGKRKKERDPRTSIIMGIFFMLLSLFILLSFVTYLFGFSITGDVGEYIGKGLSEYAFGIGSAYLIFLLTLIGLNLTFKGPKMPIASICKYCVMFLLWTPLLTATILPHNENTELFYGIVGQNIYDLLEPHIKNIGIYIILVFIFLTYIIYTFNIRFPEIKKKEIADDTVDDDGTNADDDTDSNADDIAENEDDDENDDESEITVKHIAIDDTDDDEDTDDVDDIDDDVEITVKHINIDDTEDDADSGFEPAPVPSTLPQPATHQSPISITDQVDEIDMEITAPTEEKQAEEIGEHFGLDTNFDPKLELSNFKLPPIELLKDYGESTSNVDKEELEANKKRIVDTLANYNIAIDKIKATIGPTVTLYEIIPAAGVRISKIKGLQDDIALCLSAIGIRIIAPIPGKGTVGIEVPNQKPQIVSMRSVLGSERFQKCGYELPFGIGKTISNESYVADLAKMPHILMAGATGQGKSVGINAIISSLLYSKHPAELKFVLVDPKKVELSLYKKIERHYLAKLPDAEEAIITDVRKVVRTLNSLCIEMDNRYELLKDAQVRNIKEYNAKFISRKLNPYDGHRFLPYIVLVVDEFADLIMTAGKEVEAPIARLAQLARAIGIHLIIATQRPSVNIITGTIKANFPARIAFRVISRVDSGTILDTNGADQLIGRGDMLLSTGNDLVRLQCAFIDTPEVEEITDFIGSQRGYAEAYNLPDCPDEKDEGGSKENLDPDERDPLFEEAAYIIVQTQQGSTSMLQRKLKLGYNRAGRIIDQLEKAGIVGPFAGSKQREVRVANEMALEQFLKDLDMDRNNDQHFI